MKISGIVCEYNPFHNGHLEHIRLTRQNGATHIVAVMSGNFVQRGDVAVLDKFTRAEIAVKSGADLVIEIPVIYSLATAEVYARGAVYLLNALGCVNEISFGSECGDLGMLVEAVKASVTCSKKPELRELTTTDGMSYPVALRILVERNYGTEMAILFDGSNNLLAIEYIKAIAFLGANIEPYTVKRVGAEHDSDLTIGKISSASFIRQSITSGTDFSDFIPELTLQYLLNSTRTNSLAHIDNLEKIILYKMRSSNIKDLKEIPDITGGLENRIFEARNTTSLKELFYTIKTKRYPMARIRRIILNSLLQIEKNDLVNPPPYGRILAVNQKGCEILNEAKHKATIPFATSLAKLGEVNAITKRFADVEVRAGDIYNLATKSIGNCGKDFTTKVSVIE